MSELKAGRELDARIAREVMGIQVGCIHPSVTHIRSDSNEAVCDECGEHFGDTTLAMARSVLRPYSADIAAAMPIAEKLRLSLVCSEDGWYAIKPVDILHDDGKRGPVIALCGGTHTHFAPSETPSLAICIEALRLAALKAVES